MAAQKRQALERMGSLTDRHRVVEVDALLDSGPASLAAVAAGRSSDRGLAIVTEGLLGYLDRPSVEGIWRRFARVLAEFSHGRYISDLHIGEDQTVHVRAFRVVLSAFVHGRVHLHFSSAAEAEEALIRCGFASATVRRASSLAPGTGSRGRGSALAHILEASTR